MAGSDVSSLQVAAQRARARYRSSTDVQNNEVSIPEGFELAQNYPNPFNPSTTIAFEIPRAAFMNLSVFNILGEKVATLLDSRVTAGHHAISWDGTTDNGHSVSSGVYFYQLKSGSTVFSKKMLMMK
ncbi:MAG: T9SS type A sorting domain-containing protein [candidate division Zixibacteria bacterium]|nr:T9SS type A sorting domain-containing protein [candidate division Zixibacteria bacterium]